MNAKNIGERLRDLLGSVDVGNGIFAISDVKQEANESQLERHFHLAHH